MNLNIKYSLVIPCFNESASLMELISQIKQITARGDIEFILVNNGSSDSTELIFKEIEIPNVLTIKLKQNEGYGGGIQSGLRIASGEYVGWIHADLQYSLIDSLKALDFLQGNIKFIKGRRKGRTFFQNFISAGMSVFESVLFGRILYDINAQPTVFAREGLNYLVFAPKDFSFDLYSYVVLKRHGFKVFRFRVAFMNRSFGKSSWNSGIKSIFKMSTRTIKYSLNLRMKNANR